MKKIYVILFLLGGFMGFAQVQNKTVTDCNNQSRDIYSVLASGKALLIASEGLDCSSCMSKAMGLQNWASQNSGDVEVWGAMTFTYKSSNPSCTQVDQWVQNYSWNDIFAFIDASRTWFSSGTPQYYVYDPSDSSLAYQGFSESTAQTTALSLSNSSGIGIEEIEEKKVEIGNGNGFVTVKNLPPGIINYELMDITGKVIKRGTLQKDAVEQIRTDELKTGLYLLKLEGTNNFAVGKKVYIR